MNLPTQIRPPVQPRPPIQPSRPLSPLAQGARGYDPFGLSSGKDAPAPPKPPTLLTHAAGQKPATAAVAHPIGQGAGSPYDLNTDPGVQAAAAAGSMSDQQAQASALRARQQALLGYGDPNLAKAVLGDGMWASAASNNPSSVLAHLARSRDQNLKTLTDNLNANNLDYSGYRVNQEQQQGQEYQDALAQAAAQIQSQLGGIDSDLTGALQGSQQQRVQAISDAATRAMSGAVTTGLDPGAAIKNHPATPAKKVPPQQLARSFGAGSLSKKTTAPSRLY